MKTDNFWKLILLWLILEILYHKRWYTRTFIEKILCDFMNLWYVRNDNTYRQVIWYNYKDRGQSGKFGRVNYLLLVRE